MPPLSHRTTQVGLSELGSERRGARLLRAKILVANDDDFTGVEVSESQRRLDFACGLRRFAQACSRRAWP